MKNILGDVYQNANNGYCPWAVRFKVIKKKIFGIFLGDCSVDMKKTYGSVEKVI